MRNLVEPLTNRTHTTLRVPLHLCVTAEQKGSHGRRHLQESYLIENSKLKREEEEEEEASLAVQLKYMVGWAANRERSPN